MGPGGSLRTLRVHYGYDDFQTVKLASLRDVCSGAPVTAAIVAARLFEAATSSEIMRVSHVLRSLAGKGKVQRIDPRSVTTYLPAPIPGPGG